MLKWSIGHLSVIFIKGGPHNIGTSRDEMNCITGQTLIFCTYYDLSLHTCTKMGSLQEQIDLISRLENFFNGLTNYTQLRPHAGFCELPLIEIMLAFWVSMIMAAKSLNSN